MGERGHRYVLREQKEDEAHAVHDLADVRQELREGHGPQIRGDEGGFVVGEAVATSERESSDT